MSTPHLTPMEVAILQGMDGFLWSAHKIADDSGLPLHPDKVRRKLHKLRKLGLVERYDGLVDDVTLWRRTKLGAKAAKQ